jgi:hypothetical protein
VSIIEQSEFEDRYHELLMRSWTSEDFTMEMLSNPSASLGEIGLVVPEGTAVTIKRQPEGEGSIDDQYQLWTEGIARGQVVLVVPEIPPIDLGVISDSELEAVSGGTTYCCCPCCTCTA